MNAPLPAIVYYHAGCLDGLSAAWAIGQFEDDPVMCAIDYGDVVEAADVRGRVVYMLDIVLGKSVMRRIAAEAARLIMIDHHLPNAQIIRELCDDWSAEGVFSIGASAASLAFDWVQAQYAGTDLQMHDPWQLAGHDTRFIDYVDDYDRYVLAMPNSRFVYRGLIGSLDLAKATPQQLGSRIVADGPEHFERIGRTLARDDESLIDELIGQNTLDIEIGGYRVPACNGPRKLRNEIGDRLAAEAAFGVCYQIGAGGEVRMSLRAKRETQGVGPDLAQIAAEYGGSGHPTAAGLRVSLALFGEMIGVDESASQRLRATPG